MDLFINNISIIVLIAGLVEFAKKFGLRGNGCILLSMLLGVFFGIAYQLQSGVPATVAGWLETVVFGLALGLTTSGLWDVVTRRDHRNV